MAGEAVLIVYIASAIDELVLPALAENAFSVQDWEITISPEYRLLDGEGVDPSRV